MNIQRLSIVLLLSALLAGCQLFFPSKSIPVERSDLADICAQDWLLDAMIIDGEPQSLAEGVDISLSCEVEANSTKVNGMASINRYFGHMSIDGDDKLDWHGPGFATTMMAGPEPLMAQEHRYLELLQQSCGIAIEGEMIVFSCAGKNEGKNRLIFRDRFK